MSDIDYVLHLIGFIRSSLKDRADAPRQGSEGAHDAWIVVTLALADVLDGIAAGDQMIQGNCS